jgi:FMN-dependent oxidoreductase (nitrilotriacetate monooxygenase family)
MFFVADHLAVPNMPMEALKRSATVTSCAPMTLLPALAAVTDRIGLVATMSTTNNEPFHVARLFASLDHLGGGREGWNVATSTNPQDALNFSGDAHLEHDARYLRAREFYEVVTELWDSWADDAFVRDKDNNVYFEPSRMRVPGHRGAHFRVRGPLNVARPVQGWPVIVQAGQSDAGRQLAAAETTEVVFSGLSSLDASRSAYADIKARALAAGRDTGQVKVPEGVDFGVASCRATSWAEVDTRIMNASRDARVVMIVPVRIQVALPNGV